VIKKIKETRRRVGDLRSLVTRLKSITDLNAENIEVEGVVEVKGGSGKQIHVFFLATDLDLAL
jgi:hypothetical protein